MVGGGRSCDIGEVVVAKGEAASVSEVGRNIRLDELCLHCPMRSVQPRFVAMVVVPEGWVGRTSQRDAVGAGERPEVVVEGVILLENHDDVLNRRS